MVIKKSNLLYALVEQITNNSDIESLVDILKISLSDYFEVGEINFLYFDSQLGKLFNVMNDFEPAEESFSNEKIKTFILIRDSLNSGRKYVLNDDVSIPEDVFDSGNYVIKSLSFGLRVNNENVGLLRFKLKQKLEVTFDDVMFLQTVVSVLAVKVQNIVIGKKLETNLEFYKSMKGIAKIIETQYDYQYIIPLIGEMIDKVVLNHLIYIFLKKDDKFVLYWPNACWNQQVYELMDELSVENKVVLSENKKTGVFGLVGESGIVGCTTQELQTIIQNMSDPSCLINNKHYDTCQDQYA